MKSSVAFVAMALVAVFSVAAAWCVARVYALLQRVQGDHTGQRDELWGYWEDERRRALHNLREVQFDFDTGKIDRADFDELSARYERKAAEAIAALRKLKGSADGGVL